MSWDEEERRVAEILGVKKGEALPHVSRQTLRTYHAYLKANLEFPFKAIATKLILFPKYMKYHLLGHACT